MQDLEAVETRRPPDAGEIRAQLERIISSPEFPGVGRGAAFLRYIVEETLEGRQSRIKGYSIALEIFKRDERFSQDDPIVRIEAGRLRRAIERYYLIAGHSDPVRIDMPKGGYVPVFSWNVAHGADYHETDPKQSAIPALQAPGRWPKPRFMLAWATLVAIVVAGLTYWTMGHLGENGKTMVRPNEPTILVAPFANLGEGGQAEIYTTGLTEELLTTLPRFKEIRVFGRETSKGLPPEVDVRKVRKDFGAQYLLAGGVRVAGGRMRVSVRLVDTVDGAILWSQNYDNDLGSRDLFTIQTDVANQVAISVAQPYGIIAQADSIRPPPDDLGAYKCTLDFYDYRTELSADRHAAVRACLESAVARYPVYATAWAMLSMAYLDEDRYKFNPIASKTPPVERALQAARRAAQIEPGNTRALQALMTALFFNRQLPDAIRVGEQALATNPNDTELMGEFGTRIAIAGQWQRGAELLDRAIALNPGGGGFYRGTRGLASYMLGDIARAVTDIRQADMQKFPLFHAVAAVIYAEARMMADSHREADVLKKMRPDFIRNFVAEMMSRNINPKDLDRLKAGLAKAGLDVGHKDPPASQTAELP